MRLDIAEGPVVRVDDRNTRDVLSSARTAEVLEDTPARLRFRWTLESQRLPLSSSHVGGGGRGRVNYSATLERATLTLKVRVSGTPIANSSAAGRCAPTKLRRRR